MNAWGVVRGTRDVDVVVKTDATNLDRLAKLAVELGAHIETGDAVLSTPFGITERLGSGERVQLETDIGSLDIVQGLPGVLGYDELRERASDVEILGVTVAVCSLEDLRSMKRAAGRARDLADLEDLDAAHGD